jgi:hypothetical protein
LATKASQAVITPVDPCRPVPTQLSLSLTTTMPAKLRFACFWLAATSGSEQSVQVRSKVLVRELFSTANLRCVSDPVNNVINQLVERFS